MEWVKLLVTVLVSVLASSGFWAFVQKRSDRNDNKNKLLIGLGHDRIMYLGMRYINRGWISRDEYENLNEYLYKPYSEAGGNGSAKRIMAEVDKLPIHDVGFYEKGDDDK